MEAVYHFDPHTLDCCPDCGGAMVLSRREPEVLQQVEIAEQAIRFVVIDRHVTQGTRSEKGRRWCERIWTVIATCAQQGRAVFHFLLDSVQAHLCGTSPPSLLPSGS